MYRRTTPVGRHINFRSVVTGSTLIFFSHPNDFGEFMKSIFMFGVIFMSVTCITGCQTVDDQVKYLTGESGCKKHYKSSSDAADPVAQYSDVNRPPPIIVQLSEEKLDIRALIMEAMGQGYFTIGSCEFYGDSEEGRFTSIQAKSVKADAVISHVKYKDTQYVSGQSGGYSYRTYEWTHLFFRKAMWPEELKLGFWVSTDTIGIFASDLIEEERKIYKRNTGVLIRLVVKDSPAYYAELIPGDVIVGIDGIVVRSEAQYRSAISAKIKSVISTMPPTDPDQSRRDIAKKMFTYVSSADESILGDAEISFVRDGVERKAKVPFMRMYEAEKIFSR